MTPKNSVSISLAGLSHRPVRIPPHSVLVDTNSVGRLPFYVAKVASYYD